MRALVCSIYDSSSCELPVPVIAPSSSRNNHHVIIVTWYKPETYCARALPDPSNSIRYHLAATVSRCRQRPVKLGYFRFYVIFICAFEVTHLKISIRRRSAIPSSTPLGPEFHRNALFCIETLNILCTWYKKTIKNDFTVYYLHVFVIPFTADRSLACIGKKIRVSPQMQMAR